MFRSREGGLSRNTAASIDGGRFETPGSASARPCPAWELSCRMSGVSMAPMHSNGGPRNPRAAALLLLLCCILSVVQGNVLAPALFEPFEKASGAIEGVASASPTYPEYRTGDAENLACKEVPPLSNYFTVHYAGVSLKAHPRACGRCAAHAPPPIATNRGPRLPAPARLPGTAPTVRRGPPGPRAAASRWFARMRSCAASRQSR